jgi:hypothetical protein
MLSIILMERACEQDQTPDGLMFDPATAEGSAIRAEAATVGVRVRPTAPKNS